MPGGLYELNITRTFLFVAQNQLIILWAINGPLLVLTNDRVIDE